MPDINDDWVVLDTHKEEERTFITSRDSVNLNREMQRGAGDLVLTGLGRDIPLEADPEIVPARQENQIRSYAYFDNKEFLKDVEKLNRKSREPDEQRMAEKAELARECISMKLFRPAAVNGRKKKLPSDISDTLDVLKDYALSNVSARDYANKKEFVTRKKIKNEHEMLATLNKRLPELIRKYENKTEYGKLNAQMARIYRTLVIQSGRVLTREKTAEGRMKTKWGSPAIKDAKRISGLNKKLESTTDDANDTNSLVVRNRKDWPLFAHKPSIDDINQGDAGNCFFLCALAAIPSEKIREMMLDHGDGTVTVRFYEKDRETGKRRPVYVTVDKTVNIASSLDCLWVQVMEKAYALFRQNMSGNRMAFTQRKVRKRNGEMVIAPEKTIARDVIDLGYIGNGGQSHTVLGDLLGTDETRISVYRSKKKKTHSQVCLEALQHSTEQGAGFLEIQKLKDRMEEKKDKVKYILAGKQISFEDVATIRDEILMWRKSIQGLKDEMKKPHSEKELEYYTRNIKSSQEQIEQLEESIVPIKSVLYEYWDEEKKTEDGIKELKKKYKIADEGAKMVLGNEHFKEHESGRLEPVEAEKYGMEEELERFENRIRSFNKDSDEQVIAVTVNAGRIKVQEIITDFLTEFEKANKGIFKNNSLSSYDSFLRAALKSAGNKDGIFKNTIDKAALDACFGGNAEEAANAVSEFIVPLIEKMLPNLRHIDEVGMEDEYGKEDINALKYFREIRTMLNLKQSVCVGTIDFDTAEDGRGSAGEAMSKGMVGGHAYTVLDTRVTKSGGRLIKLRNPWARYVSGYKTNKSTGKLESYAVKNKVDTNGVFWIELNHFMQHVSMIYGSGKAEV